MCLGVFKIACSHVWCIFLNGNNNNCCCCHYLSTHTHRVTQMERELTELSVNCSGRCHAERHKPEKNRETISPVPRSHEGHNSAESKTTQWNRKSVFLGIHLHSNYSDILGRAFCTGVTKCTAAKRTLGTLIRATTHTKKNPINMRKGQNQINQRKDKIRGLFSWQHFAPASCAFLLSFFSLSPSCPSSLG